MNTLSYVRLAPLLIQSLYIKTVLCVTSVGSLSLRVLNKKKEIFIYDWWAPRSTPCPALYDDSIGPSPLAKWISQKRRRLTFLMKWKQEPVFVKSRATSVWNIVLVITRESACQCNDIKIPSSQTSETTSQRIQEMYKQPGKLYLCI